MIRTLSLLAVATAMLMAAPAALASDPIPAMPPPPTYEGEVDDLPEFDNSYCDDVGGLDGVLCQAEPDGMVGTWFDDFFPGWGADPDHDFAFRLVGWAGQVATWSGQVVTWASEECRPDPLVPECV